MTLSRVILTTGGTGGHTFPALAVAEELRARNAEAALLFVGGLYGPERELAAKAGVEFYGLPVRGVIGRGFAGVKAMLGLLAGAVRAMGVVGRFRPQAVVGFGGYAAFGAMAAGALRGVPTALHEQNALPGVSNKILGRLARKVFLSVPDTAGAFDAAKTVLTGNPVRSAIAAVRRQERGETKHLLVLGGSQGARNVNSAVVAALGKLMEAGVVIRHQTGRADHERVKAAYEMAGASADGVTPFIDDMAEAYVWADLVVGRAGATTIAEMAVAGVPGILIPFPHAAHDHQTVNARCLADAHAALCVQERELGSSGVAGYVLPLLADEGGREKLAAMRTAALGLGRPDAAARIVDELEKLAG